MCISAFVCDYVCVCSGPALSQLDQKIPNWALRPILQTLVQVDWEPGPTEIVPNLAPHLLKPALCVWPVW